MPTGLTYNEIINILNTGETTVYFNKISAPGGRILRGTLDRTLIPEDNHPEVDITYLPNNEEGYEDLVSIWDLDKEAWRSFKLSELEWYE